jgi:hypothetical protein
MLSECDARVTPVDMPNGRWGDRCAVGQVTGSRQAFLASLLQKAS